MTGGASARPELAAAWGAARVVSYETVGSTNDALRRLAAEGAPPGTVVIAREQTAGRGRRGAGWHSPAGCGLWLSYLAPAASGSVVWLPLAVGLAAARAVESTRPVHVGLKWPNDLFLTGRKIGGVLCEARPGGVVVGVGVNVFPPPGGFPPEISASAAAIAGPPGAAGEVEAARAIEALAGALVGELNVLVERIGGIGTGGPMPPELSAGLSARDVLIGRAVDTEAEGPGIARGIDAAGGLLLERPDGSRVTVVAGSVRPVSSSADPVNDGE